MKAYRCMPLLFIAAGFLVAGCKETTVEGPSGSKMSLVKPVDFTIHRGATEKESVMVTRPNVNGPVTVRFDDLPKGVTIVDDKLEIEGNKRAFVFKAADSADLVSNHVASVTVTSPDGTSATEKFKISVVEKS